MTSTGFINGQDESRCYDNLLFQVHFFNIFFRQLIMNIGCDKIIEDMEDSEDEFRSHFTKKSVGWLALS